MKTATSQRAISAAIRLLEAEGYTVTRPAVSPAAWDYTLVRKYAPQGQPKEILSPALKDL